MKRINARCKANWDYLLEKFTPEYIESMTDMKEYVIGFGSNNKSFCYLVEAGTKDFGEIRGANASKFGLWYGKHGSDKTDQYRATKKNFNCDINLAFERLKLEVARIIRISKQLDQFSDVKSILSPLFKYKIMYLYNQKIMIPSFEIENLKHFEDCLNLPITDSYEVCQRQLLEYKNTNYPDWSNLEFGCYLYETYGKFVVAKSKEANDIADNQLNRELSSIKEPTDDYITHEVGKAKLVKSGDYLIYPRDGRVSARALKNARYKCENNENHECFIRKSNGKPYTEVHHLIPLCYHYRFKCSLDVPENIISLCSNCHNEIHYGKDANKLIEKFYNERKAKLHDAGIDITLDELLDMY